MTSDSMERALRRAEDHLLAEVTPEGLIARREAGIGGADADAAVGAAAEVAGESDAGGGWGESLRATAEALTVLRELDPEARGFGVRQAVEQAAEWLRSRRHLPNAFAAGCTPGRHELGLCHHFVTGFFAPTPADDAETEDARLAASCVVLRAWLGWGLGGNDADLHLDAVRRIVLRRSRWQEPAPTPATYIAAVAALLAAPAPEYAAAAGHGVALLVGAQRADGSWPDTDSFDALDLLEAAARRGHDSAELAAAVERAAEQLAVTQQPNGTWGRNVRNSTTLMGWRALRRAAGLATNSNRTHR